MILYNEQSPYYPKTDGASDQRSTSGFLHFGAAYADHPHFFQQVDGLLAAGGRLCYLYDNSIEKRAMLSKRYPDVLIAPDEESFLAQEISLVVAAGVPAERAAFGQRVLQSGKDYFVDKAGFTTLKQLESARRIVQKTGQKYLIFFGERLMTESAWYLGKLVEDGVFGDVLQISITGPHKLGITSRPDWFYSKKQTGGILTDIASHQFDQFLAYADCLKGRIMHAWVDNRCHPETPELEDIGEAILHLENGTSCYSRVDWFAPEGTPAFGDGRTFLVGSKATAEARKYVNPGLDDAADTLIITDKEGEHILNLKGVVGYPFFKMMIDDCLNRTEFAITQNQIFAASKLSLEAQALADKLRENA